MVMIFIFHILYFTTKIFMDTNKFIKQFKLLIEKNNGVKMT